MPIILSDDGIDTLKDALRSNASDRERNNALAELQEAADLGLPDEIDLFRAIKASGARKRIDIARAILRFLQGDKP
jgi:hypothetical protein